MPADTRAIAGVDDSQRLTHDQRVGLAVKIRETPSLSPLARLRSRDRPHQHLSGERARDAARPALRVKPDHVGIVAGRSPLQLRTPPCAGDARAQHRLRIDCRQGHPRSPQTRLGGAIRIYLGPQRGYTTREHVAGLAAHGITPHHRKSFCRSASLLEIEHRRSRGREQRCARRCRSAG